jgi:hypothetical protein
MAMTRLQKLDKKGIFVVFIDDVMARMTEKQSKNALQKSEAMPILRAGAAALVGLKKRVMQRGQLGDNNMFPGYRKRAPVTLSKQYAQAAGVATLGHLNEDMFHKKLKSRVGSYVVTGGMWKSAEVRTSGREVIAEFVGKSMGRGIVTREKIEYLTKTGKKQSRTKRTAEPSEVDNRFKAGRIWLQHKINVLAPRRGELVLLAQWAALTQQQRQMTTLTGEQYSSDKFTPEQRATLLKLSEG